MLPAVACVAGFLAVSTSLAQEGTRVQGLETAPQPDGSIRVSWDAPASAEEVAIYTIRFSEDLEQWLDVEDPEIVFADERAVWVDDGSLTGTPALGGSRFYRVWEQLPIDLDRITRRFGEEGEIPLAVRYAPELEPFVASEANIARAEARYQLSSEQDLSHVLGHYIVSFAEDIFPYAIEREGEGDNSDMLVTEEGVPLQQLAAELVEAEGGELLFVWQAAIQGFSAYLPPNLVDQLEASPLIESVEGVTILQFEETWGGSGD